MFTLPKLPYNYNDLEPFIDEQTMLVHHTKHHQAYLDKFNATLTDYPDFQQKTAEELLENLDDLPQEIKQAVINSGGGYVNHSFFWQILRPVSNLSKQEQLENYPQGEVAKKIDEVWGYEQFKEKFSQAAVSQFGSGWAWLAIDELGELKILSSSNQDSPLSSKMKPLLALDVWEHAYYLKYQNKRPEYIENFWPVINWQKVEEIFLRTK